MLQPLGFELREASNGQAALDQARDWRPDLILMDMFMPIMTGFDAARAIRQQAELAGIIIISLSASVAQADTQRILEAGCDAALPKPVDVKQLLAAIKTHLDLTWIQDEITEAPVVEAEREIVLPPSVPNWKFCTISPGAATCTALKRGWLIWNNTTNGSRLLPTGCASWRRVSKSTR